MINNIIVCKKCITPSSRPRIQFEGGICNACKFAEEKQKIDWDSRSEKFAELLGEVKKKDRAWDCIVPFSGGKDSASIAHKLKSKFDLNPLLVTFSPMIPNKVGEENREAMLKEGFDNIYFRPNQKVMRTLAKRFFIERGNPKVCWEAGVNSYPVQVALSHKIPLIMFAEHGESEYGGKVIDEKSRMIRNFTEVIEHQVGDHPLNWVDNDITEGKLYPYLYPDLNKIDELSLKVMYFSYFFKWSMFDNYEYVKKKYEFKLCSWGRTIGTFTNFDSLDDKIDDLYYYMQYIKFGFGRCVRDASRLIQNGHISRKEGIEYARNFDGEFPSRNLDAVLEYLDLSYEDFIDIIDRHRNPEIWKKINGKWKLDFETEWTRS